MIRFWDTSALVKAYSPREAGHAAAVRALHPRTREVRHMTSMLVAVELVSALVRRTGDRELGRAVMRQLDAFDQVEFGEAHRELALRLALGGATRCADTAIAAQALLVGVAAAEAMEFLTADIAQARLVRSEARRRAVAMRVVELPI
ncbi:MAG: PIN domain-containing protein [Candidatus Binatia bacterium]